MDKYTISDEEFENYFLEIKKDKKEKYKTSKDFNNIKNDDNLINSNKLEKNPEIYLNYKEENKNINYVNFLVNSYNLKNKIKKTNNNESKEGNNNSQKKKKRTSKFYINRVLFEYFYDDPEKWSKGKIDSIAKKTKWNKLTIYNWNIKQYAKKIK